MSNIVIDLETKRLEKLKPRELAPYLMTLPPRQRMDMIVNREDAAAVVAAIPEQDFYLTIKEVGPGDALSLLGLAQLDQLNHVFDIEWWKKDQLSPAKALHWLELLAQASEHKFAQWLYNVDFELLVTLFKKWIRVATLPDDADLVEARDQLPPLTLDDQFFWEARYPQYEDFIRSILSFLFETHQGFYRELMTYIVYALDTEYEEMAYRFHRGRLEDRAIPDFYDALEIYRFLHPGEIPHGKVVHLSGNDRSSKAPFFPLVLISDKDLFSRALLEIRDRELLDVLQLELAALGNKVIVADQLPPDDPEVLRNAAAKAAAMVNLGLDLLTHGEAGLAPIVLQDIYLEHLFRLANTRVAKLRLAARHLVEQGWLAQWPYGANLLEPDWQEALELLMRKTPRLKRTGGEDFLRTRSDLHRAKRIVTTIAALKSVFDVLATEGQLAHLEHIALWSKAQINRPEDITLGTLLLTGAARFLWQGKWQLEPLPVSSWSELFPCVGAGKIQAAVRNWLKHAIKDSVRLTAMEPYMNSLLTAYGEEIGAFSEVEPPDPRLWPYFMFAAK